MPYFNCRIVEGVPPPGWPFPADHRWLRSPAERSTAVVYFLLSFVCAAIFTAIGLAAQRGQPLPLLIMLAVALAASLPFAVAGYRMARRYRSVRDRGVEVVGTVDYAWVFSTGSGSRRVVQFALAIRYPLGDGSEYLAGQVHPRWYRELAPGMRVRLRYHPGDRRYFTILGRAD